jgi:hypothetical protein
MSAPRTRRIIPTIPPKSYSQQVYQQLANNLAKANNKLNQSETAYQPLSDFTAMLLHKHDRIVPTPLEPRKLFYKLVRYQDTIQVNANGHLFAGGSFRTMVSLATNSSASTIAYVNEPTYNPTSTTNALTGGWNINIIGNSGLNLSPTAFPNGYIVTAKVAATITGVSNLNKQGQVHIFEDNDEYNYRGTATDTSYSEILVNDYPLQDLPKCVHYKSVDIVNADSDTALEYTYIPLSLNADSELQQIENFTGSGYNASRHNKVFGFIVSNAAPGTTLRLQYSIVVALDVSNNFISDYPPIFSKIHINPDPLLMLLNQDSDVIIRVHKHDDKDIYKTVENKIRIVNGIGSNQLAAIRPKFYPIVPKFITE